MGKGTLTIYSASAGSGKTYTLTEIYLSSLFQSRFNYRKILAVTFTNKATAEMKSRILESLYKLASGQKSDYLVTLSERTGRSEEWIRKEAGEILFTVLHDYSRFSISTIDSFFQKILRAFVRDAGLQAGFNIEIDHSAVLSSAVDEMLESAGEGTLLNKWLTGYVRSNIDEERGWNLRSNIMSLAEELFKERFRILSRESQSRLEDKEFLLTYIGKLRHIASSFEKELQDSANKALGLFSTYSLSDDMFYMKGRGIPGYVRALAAGEIKIPSQTVCEILNTPPRWSTAAPSPGLQAGLAGGLEEVVTGLVLFTQQNIKDYKSSKAILSNIYSLGILSDILGKIRTITQDENSFILSEAGDVLSQITGEDQSPFIYEKVGNRFENFMVDEFQDTSYLQWKNLQPLISNSMAEGFDNLVVGDVKQSIYRWRNGDWKILGVDLDSKVDGDRFIRKPLTSNWRSLSNIIRFNNSLFTVIPSILDTEFEGDNYSVSFSKMYAGAVQDEPVERPGGYVRVEFVDDEAELRSADKILKKLPEVVESLESSGYEASDIGILVRDNREGASVLRTFIDYSNNCPPEKHTKFNYNIVSGDSLLLSNSHVINFIISVLRSINNPEDKISRALMLRYYLLTMDKAEADSVSLISDRLEETSAEYFPEGFRSFLEQARHLPLFEATENIIGFFGLGKTTSDIAYLSTFQDYVLNFSGSRSSDLQSFLDWFDETGSGKSVVLPGNQNAIRILTIHKSKGLEFKAVIIPFMTWNLDHINSRQPYLWIKPEAEPFNEIGLVPVKYSSELAETWFASSYTEEKHSIYVDNINLLYVALTRAREVLYGFSSARPQKSSIGSLLKNAFTSGIQPQKAGCFDLDPFFNDSDNVFEFGKLPSGKAGADDGSNLKLAEYVVGKTTASLKLKLQGENYFSKQGTESRERLNYGRIMHTVFENIKSCSDVQSAVGAAVNEGLLTEAESEELETRIRQLISKPEVADWFSPDNKVSTETGIVIPAGSTRRPDRIVFTEQATIVIDFKFGEESLSHARQVNSYKRLLSEMGYRGIEGFLWYVDKDQIIKV